MQKKVERETHQLLYRKTSNILTPRLTDSSLLYMNVSADGRFNQLQCGNNKIKPHRLQTQNSNYNQKWRLDRATHEVVHQNDQFKSTITLKAYRKKNANFQVQCPEKCEGVRRRAVAQSLSRANQRHTEVTFSCRSSGSCLIIRGMNEPSYLKKKKT